MRCSKKLFEVQANLVYCLSEIQRVQFKRPPFLQSICWYYIEEEKTTCSYNSSTVWCGKSRQVERESWYSYRFLKIRDCSIAGESSWNLYFSLKNQRTRRRLLINKLTKGVLDFGKEEADQQLKCWDKLIMLHINIVWQFCIFFINYTLL